MQNDKKYEKIENWLAFQETPQGKLRYELTELVLNRYIKGKKLNILDIGGGNGKESLWLAKKGHNITIVDISKKMLLNAKKKFDENKVGNNLNIINTDLSNGFKIDKKFDVILIHNLFSYIDNVEQIIEQAFEHLSMNGILSIMQVNKYSEIFPPIIFENNLDKAYENIDATKTKIELYEDTEVYRYTAEELVNKINKYTVKQVQKYGILSMSYLIKDNELKYEKEFYEKLKKIEIRLMQEYPYTEIARFNLIIVENK